MERFVAAFQEALSRAAAVDAGAECAVSPLPRDEKSASPWTNSPDRPERGLKPNFPPRESIDAYAESELRRLAEWILADGQLRTDEEVIQLMFDELPFKRRGARILERLEDIVKRLAAMRRG
jgi:hypothetical protein